MILLIADYIVAFYTTADNVSIPTAAAAKKKLLMAGLRFKLLLYSSTVAENTAVFLNVKGRQGGYVLFYFLS